MVQAHAFARARFLPDDKIPANSARIILPKDSFWNPPAGAVSNELTISHLTSELRSSSPLFKAQIPACRTISVPRKNDRLGVPIRHLVPPMFPQRPVPQAFLKQIAVDRLGRRGAIPGRDDHLAIRWRHASGRI